jgi:hypothetical protein
MTLVGFKPTISVGERLQTYALDGAAVGNGNAFLHYFTILCEWQDGGHNLSQYVAVSK